MRKFFILMFLFLIGLPIPAASGEGSLRVEVSGLKKMQGQLLLAVHDRPEGYLSKDPDLKPFREAALTVDSKTASVLFDRLPYGRYAVAVFHDVNSNVELDTNLFGIPKEPYGFSNNPKTLLPPSFEEAAITLDAETGGIRIILK